MIQTTTKGTASERSTGTGQRCSSAKASAETGSTLAAWASAPRRGTPSWRTTRSGSASTARKTCSSSLSNYFIIFFEQTCFKCWLHQFFSSFGGFFGPKRWSKGRSFWAKENEYWSCRSLDCSQNCSYCSNYIIRFKTVSFVFFRLTQLSEANVSSLRHLKLSLQ